MERANARKYRQSRATDNIAGSVAGQIPAKQEECPRWYLRGAFVCYLCVIYRLAAGKSLITQRELTAFDRIHKASGFGIPIALLILFLFGLFMSWQAREIEQLQSMVIRSQFLLSLDLNELSMVKVGL